MTGIISSTTSTISGKHICLTLTRTGPNVWTGSPFTLTTYPTNAAIRSQRLLTNASAKIIIYTGDTPGALTITDTLNGETYSFRTAASRPIRVATGTQYFVTGGLFQPDPPHATIDAATGTTARYYQVIAINSAGKTKGFTAISKTLPNSTQTTWKWGPGITTVNLGPTTVDGTNTITLNWAAVPFATSYDLIKSTDGTTWVSMTGSLGIVGLTYTDTGATTAAYTLPTVNGTGLGSDANGGGFDPNVAGGTNRANQATAFQAYTDIAIDAVTNTKISSAAHPFDSTSAGNIINVTAGTGFTVQRIKILSVLAGVATCDKAVGAVGSTGGTGNLGGALATMAKAFSLTVSGDGIACSKCVSDSAKVNDPGGVIVTGPAMAYSTFSGAGASYFPRTGSEYSDIIFKTDVDTQFLFGGSASPDTAAADIRVRRCSFIGQTNVVRIAFTTYIDFEDSFFYTHHGSFGMVSGAADAVCNLTRCRFFAFQDIGHVNKSDVLPINHNEGFLLLRDCSIFATQDSQNPTDQFCYGIFIGQGGGTPVGLELINCQIVAPNQIVIDPATVALAGIWTRDTMTDPNIAGSVTASDAGNYIADPSVVVSSGGGSGNTGRTH